MPQYCCVYNLCIGYTTNISLTELITKVDNHAKQSSCLAQIVVFAPIGHVGGLGALGGWLPPPLWWLRWGGGI